MLPSARGVALAVLPPRPPPPPPPGTASSDVSTLDPSLQFLGSCSTVPRIVARVVVVCCPCVFVGPSGAQGTVQQLSNGDLLRPLLIECWDYDRAGGHDFIGGCSASIADMQVRWEAYLSALVDGPPEV